jgi:hypothetical protein
MSLLDAVKDALEGDPGMRWQRELALGMAAELDEKANASLSNSLRALMDDLGVAAVEQKGDVSDDLAAKRAARRSAAG